LFQEDEGQALAATEYQYLPAEEYPYLLLRLYDTDYIITIY